MKHKHHIVPKHAGGTDEPSNLVEVSVEEHAELHLYEYLCHGLREDFLAYHALSGQIGKEEIQLERSRIGQINSQKAMSPEGRQRQFDASHTKEANEKRRKTQTGKKRAPYKLKVVNKGWGKGGGRKPQPVTYGDKTYATMKECAKDLGIHLITAYRWKSEGRIQ